MLEIRVRESLKPEGLGDSDLADLQTEGRPVDDLTVPRTIDDFPVDLVQ